MSVRARRDGQRLHRGSRLPARGIGIRHRHRPGRADRGRPSCRVGDRPPAAGPGHESRPAATPICARRCAPRGGLTRGHSARSNSMIRFVVAALAAPAGAQTYPARPIRMIVPFPPGGGTDAVSRLVATELAKSTGWTVVIENKAGAGGMIGLQEAARARNDGYDIVMGQVDNMVIAPAVQRTGIIDPVKDLTP